MKKIILLLSLLLSLLILLPTLVACKKTDNLSKLESFSICNNDIAKYRIIYASPDPEAVKWENYYFGIDYKFDQITANELKSQIHSIFGVELEVLCDTQTEAVEYEILIGKTNREETQELGLDLLSQNESTCQVANNKLILCGGNYSSTYHSIDLLIEEFRQQADSGSSTVSIDASFKFEEFFSPQNIAVIGDETFSKSISSDTDRLTVPSVLQRLLWKNCSVTSYLEADSIVRSDLSKGVQYTATESYEQLLRDCSKLDAVIINLGTFDLYYSEDEWDKTDDAMFISSYKSIIEELHSINKNLKFYICTTVKAGDNRDITDAQTSFYSALKELDYDVTLIELDNLMGEYITARSFINEIYPNEFASAIIAKRIADEIKQNDP